MSRESVRRFTTYTGNLRLEYQGSVKIRAHIGVLSGRLRETHFDHTDAVEVGVEGVALGYGELREFR